MTVNIKYKFYDYYEQGTALVAPMTKFYITSKSPAYREPRHGGKDKRKNM